MSDDHGEVSTPDGTLRLIVQTWYFRFMWSKAGANVITENGHHTWLGWAWDKTIVPQLSLDVYVWAKPDRSDQEIFAAQYQIREVDAGFREVTVGYTVPGVGVSVWVDGWREPQPLSRIRAVGWAHFRNGAELQVEATSA